MMEVGQIIHNNPVGFPAPRFVAALLEEIRDEISRVYWNVNQTYWAQSRDCPDPFSWEKPDQYSFDPGIPGIEWRPYYNWGGSPEDEDWDQAEAEKPNFLFEDVEFRWYKRYGRSLNVNVCWSADKWVRWFERCMQTISAFEDERHKIHYGNPTPWPDPDGKLGLDATPDDLRFLELMQTVHRFEAQLNCIVCICIDVSNGKVPQFEQKDWRWCRELELVTRLGNHALKAPDKFRLRDDQS